MSIQTLQQQVEAKLDIADPVGAKIRKLKRRLIALERNKHISAKDYREVAEGWPRVKELEDQRKELIILENSLGQGKNKLMRLSKNYDTVTERFEKGKVDPGIYETTLRKMVAALLPPKPVGGSIGMISINAQGLPLPMLVSHTLQQAFMAVLVIFILIPALFACSGHG